MAKKRRTSRKPGRKEALAVIILAMFVGLARQMLAPSYDLSNILDYDGTGLLRFKLVRDAHAA